MGFQELKEKIMGEMGPMLHQETVVRMAIRMVIQVVNGCHNLPILVVQVLQMVGIGGIDQQVTMPLKLMSYLGLG